MSQRHQLQRILEIDQRIRSEQFPNADSLSADLEVGRRVIFNDRRFMVDQLKAPIEFDKARGGWRYTSPTYALPSAIVTEGELLAFFISVEVACRYLGTAYVSTGVRFVSQQRGEAIVRRPKRSTAGTSRHRTTSSLCKKHR